MISLFPPYRCVGGKEPCFLQAPAGIFERNTELIDTLDSSDLFMLLALAVLVALSAFCSSTETAYSTVNQIRLRQLADDGNKHAKTALAILGNYDRTLSTILIGNNIVNIGSASLATVFFTRFFHESGALISTVVMTLVVLTFGEIIPKSYAKTNSEQLTLAFAPYLHGMIVAFRPLSAFFVWLTGKVSKPAAGEEPTVTAEELKYIIDQIEQEGVLDQSESKLVQSALDFEETVVSEILTPRVDMVALSVDTPPDEALELVLNERFSRIPVYEKNVDNIIGVLQSRDLLERRVRGEPANLRELLTECLYIPKRLSIAELLSQFKKSKIHIAVVTDDYGGTMGIVTTEDIIEELVGEIWDEDDEVVPDMVQNPDGSWTVMGDYSVTDLLEELDIDDREFESDYSTVGGWVLEKLEHLPEAGEQVTYKNMTVTVLQVEEQRILKVLVQLAPPQEEE